MEPHRVVIVTFEGMQLLDLAGPADALRAATLLGARPGYELEIGTVDGRPVRADNGIAVGADASLGELQRSRRRIDTLLVAGGVGVDDAISAGLANGVAALARKADRVASVCNGAFVLAAAGLLDGHQATTHWAASERLAERHPEVEVVADRIHVRDRDRWTSAGVTAGIDLALALVEADHGAELAHEVAGWLVVLTLHRSFRRRVGTTPDLYRKHFTRSA